MDSTETLSGRVAEQIRRELGGSNVTKSELARRLGVSHTWVINRLTGHQDISLNEVEKIAAALGVEVATLLPSAARTSGRSPAAADRTTSLRSARLLHQPNVRTATASATESHETVRRPVIQAWRHAGVTA